MKTYSRKKTGDSTDVILDLNELCRLCMAKEDELVPIFNNDEAIPLTLRIMACVALEIFEGDGLPNKICHPCKFQLEKSYNFRKKCENSDMKLRLHLKSLQAKMTDMEEEHMEIIEESTAEEQSTEEDLVGVTQVAYIQPDQEPAEDDPENITLSSEADLDNKAACTLKAVKQEAEEAKTENENENVLLYEETSTQEVEDSSYDAIADAVKATLATQPGFDVTGQLQMKILPTSGKATQVEVTTEDGSVIVMELMTEEEADVQATAPELNEEGELKIFKCPQCPKSFARRIQLRRHTSVHMQQRGFSCGMCEKWFPTRSALVRHERIHTGERPFQCEICQKSFAQKEILYRHLMTHSGQKPYSCSHCNKGFTQREPLRLHLRTHMTETPGDISLHYCSLCPKVFCHASGLSRHLVTHTGKTFKCRDCDRSFTDKSSLRRHHKQTMHQP